MVDTMLFALLDIKTLSPQYKIRIDDVITGIGIVSENERWIGILKPSGGRYTDLDEADLIYEAIEHLQKIQPDVLTGCYLWNFDLPHLFTRVKELDEIYNRYSRTDPNNRFTGKELRGELHRTLNTLRIIDLITTEYVSKDLVRKYQKQYLKVDQIYQELTGKTPHTFPEDFHVWSSAQVIGGNPKPLEERLENDLRIEWEILQALLSQGKLQA